MGGLRSLKTYQSKRKFERTPEPPGADGSDAADRERSFCVHKHLASQLHYDLRLEHHDALLSWAVPKGPSVNPSDKRLAMMVEDHPLDYRRFEGVIPEGYGAGIVMLWDRGIWRPSEGFEDVDEAIKQGELKFELDGVKLKGSWVLVRTTMRGGGRRGGKGDDGRSWLLIKHRDRWAGDLDVTEAAPLSIKTDRDFAGILADDDPDVWQSDRPAKSGAAGAMFKRIIRQAEQLRKER